MKIVKYLSGIALALSLFVAPAMAADYGSREEAKALVDKAVELYKQDPQKALAAFNSKDGGFIDRDLYIFVFDKDGIFLANGAKPAMLGKSGLELTDVNGVPLVKNFIEVKDTGWVDYVWTHPVENKPRDKSSYIVRVGDVVIGCGYYK